MPRSEVQATASLLAAEFGARSFTSTEAAVAGVPKHRLKSAVNSGSLLRLRRGHYRVAADFVSDVPALPGLSPILAARVADRVALLGARQIPVALGDIAAACAWELPMWQVPELTIPVLYVPRSAPVRLGVQGGVRLSARDLDPARVVTGPGDLPMTDPIVTAIHVSAQLRRFLSARLVVLHGGLRRQLEWESGGLVRVDSRVLADMAADATRRAQVLDDARALAEVADVRGRRRVMEALAIADARIETALESISWARFSFADLPRPEPQARVRGASGTLWRVDFLFGPRVIGECDGAVKYHAGYTAWDEKRRQSDLEAAGFTVVRWTWEEIVHRPHVVLARIALALSRAA